MNFNSIILEELSEWDNIYKVLRRATEEEINDYLKRGYTRPEDLKGMWLMHIVEGHEDRNSIVIYIPNDGDKPYIILDPETYFWDGQVTENSPVANAIKNWELKQSLNPSTAKQFEELIDEL